MIFFFSIRQLFIDWIIMNKILKILLKLNQNFINSVELCSTRVHNTMALTLNAHPYCHLVNFIKKLKINIYHSIWILKHTGSWFGQYSRHSFGTSECSSVKSGGQPLSALIQTNKSIDSNRNTKNDRILYSILINFLFFSKPFIWKLSEN